MPFVSQFIESTVNLEFFTNWTKNQAFLNHPYSFLCSFPRSGNGWVRLILASILLEANGVDINKINIIRKKTSQGVQYICLNSEEKNYDLEDIFPDIYLMNLETHKREVSEDVKSLNLPINLIKTHHIIDCSLSKTIFLFRQPLSCLTSASLLLNKESIDKNPSEINETITYLAKFYSKMLEHYLNQKAQYPNNCIFFQHGTISVQKLVADFAYIMRFLDLQIENNMLKKVLTKFPLKSGYDKSFEQYISDNTKQIIADLCQKSYEHAVAFSNDRD